MADREAILQRLKDIAADVPGVNFATRNTLELTESRLPAVVLMEGDEESAFEAQAHPQKPVALNMTPELVIVAMTGPDQIGPTLNQICSDLIDAVTGDAQLRALLGRNGSVRYDGMTSDMGLGRAMLGRMAARFAIRYIRFPNQP
jgi:hypothetical protein